MQRDHPGDFEVIKGADGKLETRQKPKDDAAVERLIQSKRELRDFLYGTHTAHVEPEPLPHWDRHKCYCSPPHGCYPCNYCETGVFDPDTIGEDE